MNADWLPVGGLGIISSAVAWLISWRVSTARSEGRSAAERVSQDARDSSVKDDIHGLRGDIHEAMEEVRTLAAQTTKLSASQDVVNRVTGQAMESIITKLDRHEGQLSDHSGSLKLLTEIVMSRSKVMPPGPCPVNCPFGTSGTEIKKELP
jgi:type VI protein secretion system component VasK